MVQSMDKSYKILVQGTDFKINGHSGNYSLGGVTHLKLHQMGDLRFSPYMLRRIEAKQKELPYFSSEKELKEARKRGFKGGWNMSKAAVTSYCETSHFEDAGLDMFEGSTEKTIHIGYSLWVVDPIGSYKPMRVDYAAASISRGEFPGFVKNPSDMYEKKDNGIYVKKYNDYPNVLGSFALIILDAYNVRKKPENLEVMLVQRGSIEDIEHLQGTWTIPGGYTEPEYRTRLSTKFMESDLKREVLEESGINLAQLKLMPYAFIQDQFETALLWLGFTNLTSKEVFGSNIHSEIKTRLALPVRDLDSFVNSHNFDPASRGALGDALTSERLVEGIIKPVQWMSRKTYRDVEWGFNPFNP